MATVVPNAALVRRIVPAAIVESVFLIGCVMAYVVTGELLWIFLVVPVALVFGVWIVITLRAHRDQWRWQGQSAPSRDPKSGSR